MFTICLCIDIISIIFIYFSCFFAKWRQNPYVLFTKTVLYIYLAFVAYFTLLIPFFIPIPFININLSNLHMNLVPFIDVLQGRGHAILEICLNIVMFIPFGILYPFIFHKKFFKTVLVSFLLSLGIELMQWISVRQFSSCDITDLLMNTCGGILGYMLYAKTNRKARVLVTRIFPNKTTNIPLRKTSRITKIVFFIIIVQLVLRSILIQFITF